MVKILLCNGKEYNLSVEIDVVVEALERSNECDNPFIFIEQDRVKRLIRVDMIEEVVETKEFSSKNISTTVNINMDVEKLSERLIESLVEALEWENKQL